MQSVLCSAVNWAERMADSTASHSAELWAVSSVVRKEKKSADSMAECLAECSVELSAVLTVLCWAEHWVVKTTA